MALSFLTLTNNVITRMNEVVLTSANFTDSRATFTAGKLRVFTMLMDVSEVGEHTAQTVDRDTLA